MKKDNGTCVYFLGTVSIAAASLIDIYTLPQRTPLRVGTQPAVSIAIGDDTPDFPGAGPVERRGDIGEDVRAEDDAAGGGGQHVARPVRDDILPGEAFSRAVGDPLEVAADVVEAIQTAVRGEEPDRAVAVGLDRAAVEQGDGGVVYEGLARGIPAIDVFIREPDEPVAIHGDVGCADKTAGGIMVYGAGFPGREVVETDAARGDEPEPVLRVLRDTHREPVQDIARRVFERFEMQAVVHTDTFARA